MCKVKGCPHPGRNSSPGPSCRLLPVKSRILGLPGRESAHLAIGQSIFLWPLLSPSDFPAKLLQTQEARQKAMALVGSYPGTLKGALLNVLWKPQPPNTTAPPCQGPECHQPQLPHPWKVSQGRTAQSPPTSSGPEAPGKLSRECPRGTARKLPLG